MTGSIRDSLAMASRQMADSGMNLGTAGNLSVRIDEGMMITPTGVPYEQLTPDMMVEVSHDGTFQGAYQPSSEWPFHQSVYNLAPQAGAVVHAHSTFATTIACLGLEIPAFHYEVALAGGNNIRCAAYATYGTQKLADNVQRALENRRACLLANHGLIAWSETLEKAMALASKVEHLAEIYCRCLQAGEPNILDEAEMESVLARFSAYGQ